MKQLKHFLLVAAVALSLVGCNKTVEVSFGTATQEIDAQGGAIEMTLTSNGDWTIETNANWVVVSPMSGNGNATLTITAESNTTGDVRSTEIKAVTKDNTAVLSLTQGVLQNYISVTPKEIVCGSEGGEFVVDLSSNIDWAVTVPQWITCSQMEGSNNARVVLTVSPIEGEFAESRETQVLFGNQNCSDKVHVVQTIEPVLGIEIMPKILDFVCLGETKTVTVTTEDAWTASAEEDWVSLSQNEGQGDSEISVTLGENPLYVDRQTSVFFTTVGGVQAMLVIRQEASPDPHFLEVSPLEFVFGKEGGEETISIGCDTDWLFDLDCDWLSLSQLSGTGNADVILTADQNIVTEPRSTQFHIKSGELVYEFTVSQAAGDEPIVASFEPDSLFVTYIGGLQYVQLSTNVSWQLQASSWIGFTTVSSGQGDASFDITIDSNSDPEGRVGFLKAVHNGQVLCTLVVVQEGKPNILETDFTQIDARPEGGDYVIQVTSNQEWTVATNETWLHCNPQSGFANGSFTITVDALPSPRPRTGLVKVSGSLGSQVMITVDQH